MNGENQPNSQDQDSDYDGAWKEALRRHLPEFLAKFFPELYDLVDWTAEPEWLDKEISQVLGQPGRRNREVDVLVMQTSCANYSVFWTGCSTCGRTWAGSSSGT
jgi:hypothetical protein